MLQSICEGCTEWRSFVATNAAPAVDGLDMHCALDAAASKFLQAASARLGWSARSIADLAGGGPVTVAHLAEAIQCRRMLVSG